MSKNSFSNVGWKNFHIQPDKSFKRDSKSKITEAKHSFLVAAFLLGEICLRQAKGHVSFKSDFLDHHNSKITTRVFYHAVLQINTCGQKKIKIYFKGIFRGGN